MRRQGKLPRRQALHDARSVGDAEREDARLPVFGDACRSGGTPERQAGGGHQGLQAFREGRGMKLPIYLDYSETTPVDRRVAEKMIPYLTENFGNPASRSHSFGWKAEEAVEEARGHVAALLNADPKEIVWTSGATEGNNLAIKGAAHFYKTKGKHIVTEKTEHKAVLDTIRELERQGFEATYLEVEENGIVSLEKFKAAIRPDTILASIMMVNNEIGVIHPVWEIAEICRGKGIIFHCDAVQGAGRVDIDLQKFNGDLERRIPHNLNVSFNFVEGESLIMAVKDIAVSSGSACTSASLEPSYVLRALGRSDELAHSSIRLTLGRFTTQEEIDYAADLIRRKVAKLRELSPLWEMYKEGVDLNSVQWAAH